MGADERPPGQGARPPDRDERPPDQGERLPDHPPRIESFLGEPTRDLADWRWLWGEDRPFPIRSHRRLLGPLLVGLKRLVRPLVKTPQNDLWERQRVFNLILVEHLRRGEQLRAIAAEHAARLERLEAFMREGLDEVMRHNDALFSRVDQKLDRHRREARQLLGQLGAALARAEASPAGEAGEGELSRAWEERAYAELEERQRGTAEEIRDRFAIYLPLLRGPGEVLDLGCGRGEALERLGEAGVAARGVEASAEMVRHCRERGLAVVEGDLLEALAREPAGRLGAITVFHVIEHLSPPALSRLVRLAWNALAPGGRLVLETPNPLSLVAGARNFWRDPTHRRPIHPEALGRLLESAGFAAVERLDLHPFAPAERLPEIPLEIAPADLHDLVDRVNRLRDRLDELLFGAQDYALIATR
jgi:SAM-dependent methyltransferase